jgi:hypothetical protein
VDCSLAFVELFKEVRSSICDGTLLRPETHRGGSHSGEPRVSIGGTFRSMQEVGFEGGEFFASVEPKFQSSVEPVQMAEIVLGKATREDTVESCPESASHQYWSRN